VAINGLGHDTSLETLEPEVMVNILQRSNIEIHKVSCDLSPTNDQSGPNTDMAVANVAMFSTTSQNWNTASPPQWSLVAAQNVDLCHVNESRGTYPPAVPVGLRLPVATIRGDANNHNVSLPTEHGDGAPTTLPDLDDSGTPDVGYDAENILLSPDKIGPVFRQPRQIAFDTLLDQKHKQAIQSH